MVQGFHGKAYSQQESRKGALKGVITLKVN